MLIRLLLIFVLSGLVSPALAASTILVYGDSLSAAYGIPREQGWVSLLQKRLQSEGYVYKVTNASISGETTIGGLTRLVPTLEQHRPAIVLLELGANDGLRGLPVTEMQRNLSAIIETSQSIEAKVLLIGIQIPPNYGSRYTREFTESYPALAQHYKVPLLPFLLDGIAGRPELTQGDGLHPTAAAQAIILENVWKVLQPMLKTPQSKPRQKAN